MVIKMSEINEIQKETLVMMGEYLGNLIPAMEKVIAELKGDMKEDTWEYLHMIIDGFNWIIEAYNGTSNIIIDAGANINADEVEAGVGVLGKGYNAKDAEGVANCLTETIVPFLKEIKTVCDKQ